MVAGTRDVLSIMSAASDPAAKPATRPQQAVRLASAYARAVYRFELDGQRVSLEFAPVAAPPQAPPITLPPRWAIITAWNPGPKCLSDDENRRRNDELASSIDGIGLMRAPELSSDTEGRHAEPGWLIVGISREQTLMLARRFGQQAAVLGVGAHAGLLYPRTERWVVTPSRFTIEPGSK